MNKISKICGIFAVGTMMLSTFFVTSCNSEDDFDFGPDSQYSLADRKMTRAGENTVVKPEQPKPVGKCITTKNKTFTFQILPGGGDVDNTGSGSDDYLEPGYGSGIGIPTGNQTYEANIVYSIYKNTYIVGNNVISEYSCSIDSYSATNGFTVSGGIVVAADELNDSYEVVFNGSDINGNSYTTGEI